VTLLEQHIIGEASVCHTSMPSEARQEQRTLQRTFRDTYFTSTTLQLVRAFSMLSTSFAALSESSARVIVGA
jgi:hypothetical protein